MLYTFLLILLIIDSLILVAAVLRTGIFAPFDLSAATLVRFSAATCRQRSTKHPTLAMVGRSGEAVVEAIEAKRAEAVIPPRKNRTEPRPYDRDRYKDRNLAERFWSKVKQYRRVATRYEKTARNFLAFVHVASIMILLR